MLIAQGEKPIKMTPGSIQNHIGNELRYKSTQIQPPKDLPGLVVINFSNKIMIIDSKGAFEFKEPCELEL